MCLRKIKHCIHYTCSLLSQARLPLFTIERFICFLWKFSSTLKFNFINLSPKPREFPRSLSPNKNTKFVNKFMQI